LGKPEGVIAIANAIPDMRALSVLSMKRNNLGTKEAGEVLGDMLKGNSVLKELDLSNNLVSSRDGGDATAFAQGISKGLPDNGAMTSLNLASNELGVEGAKIIAACLPKCT
jgi:Ran GTPase-activating protein (RanGAP) involved in mRNA processing and transport